MNTIVNIKFFKFDFNLKVEKRQKSEAGNMSIFVVNKAQILFCFLSELSETHCI